MQGYGKTQVCIRAALKQKAERFQGAGQATAIAQATT